MDEIELGSCLLLGNAELEVVQIGKVIDETHTFNFHGKVPWSVKGVFAGLCAAVGYPLGIGFV